MSSVDDTKSDNTCDEVLNDITSFSLQNSFKRFREQKIRERKLLLSMQQDRTGGSTRSQEFKDALREKFLGVAKKYIGVPYARRFQAESDPVAPLYLDCCGLVRQVLLDLQQDFGFIIGKWNQAYQMDTLPIVLTQEELRPGDLIFYEGIYNNSTHRSKPQKHNNVHVEIFLGGETGESTLGSRYHKGTVSIFPSFKFKSTTWDLVQFHFRSIDTWLDGMCKSHCPEHPWDSASLAIAAAAGKRSIFSAQEDDDDCNADRGVEEEEEDDEADHGDGGGDGDDGDGDALAGADIGGESSNILPQPPSHPLAEPAAIAVAAVPAEGKAAAVPVALKPPVAKSKRISSSSSSSSSSGSGSAGHLSTTATGTSTLKKTSSRHSVSDTKDSKVYYVGQSNGWKMVKDSLDKRGWQQLPFEYQFSSRFGLKWVERRSQIDYRSHAPGQLVCHIPNNDCICTKVGLLATLREYFCKRSTPGAAEKRNIPWMPETFDLDNPSDCVALIDAESNAAVSDTAPADGNALWIYKPACNNRGRGIKVVTGLDSLKEICYGKLTGDQETTIAPSKGIVQRYIRDPLLVEPTGLRLKFDIRCYLLIARNFPATAAFYHPGYCRLALKAYDTSLAVLSDSCIHLTNASIQKKDPLYKSEDNKELQIQSVSAIADSMEKNGLPESAEYIRNKLDHDIKLCMVDICKASSGKLLRKHGYFDLLGCDFMLSATNQLFLLEVNTNPALSLDNSTLEQLLPGVVDGCIELVLRGQGPERHTISSIAASCEKSSSSSSSEKRSPDRKASVRRELDYSQFKEKLNAEDAELLRDLPGRYQLIYNEATGFEYSL